MGDIAQILSGAMGKQPGAATKTSSTGNAALGPPPPPPPGHHPSRAMKMTGMSREVMDLLSGKEDKRSAALPPMVPAFPPSGKSSPVPTGGNKDPAAKGSVKVGNRWISSDKAAKPWIWAPFASSARTDGALFRHWVRAGVDYPDYPYARFCIHLDPVVYTDEEYRKFLHSPTWTKSETDRLMELARRFELRWAVIYDGWIDACQAPRKIEDLQHRYYSVAAILTQSRVAKEAATEVATLSTSVPPASADTEEAKAAAENLIMETAAARSIATAEPSHQPLISTIGTGTTNKNAFDLVKERERRAHMELLWNRTKEEEQEEAELRKELRLVEAQIRKLKKSGGHILAASGAGGPPSRNPSRSATPVPSAAGLSDSDLLAQCFASTAPTPMSGTPYLQSGRLVAPATGGPVGLNKTTLKRMDDVLGELKIPERPMPTKRVCDLYDAVRKDALTLLTLQKMVLQKEGQLQSKRLRLSKLGGGARVISEETLLGIAPPAPAPVSSSSATSRSKSGGSKPKAPRTSGSKSSKVGTGKSDSGAVDAKGGGKKGTTKRKKKSEAKPPASSSAAVTAAIAAAAATPAAGQLPSANAKGDDDDGKPSKKRARKN